MTLRSDTSAYSRSVFVLAVLLVHVDPRALSSAACRVWWRQAPGVLRHGHLREFKPDSPAHLCHHERRPAVVRFQLLHIIRIWLLTDVKNMCEHSDKGPGMLFILKTKLEESVCVLMGNCSGKICLTDKLKLDIGWTICFLGVWAMEVYKRTCRNQEKMICSFSGDKRLEGFDDVLSK